MSRKINRVLLVDVSTYKVGLSDEFSQMLSLRLQAEAFLRERRMGGKLSRPSLPYSQGLLTVAAYLELDGFSVRYTVFSDPVDQQQLDGLIKEADALGFYVITPCVPAIARLLRHAKKLNPELITLAGDSHVEIRALETLDEMPELDFVLLGGAETHAGSLLRKPQRVDQIPGVAYRGYGGEPVFSRALASDTSAPSLALLITCSADIFKNMLTTSSSIEVAPSLAISALVAALTYGQRCAGTLIAS